MLKQEQVKTPELDKMLAVKDKSQAIGEFLEWLSEQHFVLAKWRNCLKCDENTLVQRIGSTEKLLGDYFSIDLAKCEQERQALLDAVREDNK